MPGVRDVILTVYASSAQAPCAKWAAEMFAEEPLVLVVPGASGTFIKQGQRWAATGDAFRAALEELAPKHADVTIRRRGLVTFSSGWQLAHHFLLKAGERQRLNALILQDGLHSMALDPWIKFATRAATGEAWMAMAHSGIDSTKKMNAEVFRRTMSGIRDSKGKVASLPSHLTNPKVPKGGFKVTVGAVRDANGKVRLPAETKVWDKDCLVTWQGHGNLYRLEYDGDDRPDHLYVAYCVAPRLWQMLADHWRG
jgi:hypothetical protein